MKTDIYLDSNATTDTFPAAREAANRAMGAFGRDANLGRLFVFQQVEGEPAQDGKVL